MSYTIELEEMRDEMLVEEIDRRARARRIGNCAYCGNAMQIKPGCKMRDQHMMMRTNITESQIEVVINDMRYMLGLKK